MISVSKNPGGSIIRDPSEYCGKEYDIIIIGGGIYGVMHCLEASRRGLRSLLLEAEDFGSQTSFNHLRIIHGGLRYLQQLDIKRFYESVGERAWFLTHFPELVKPLDCIMPLYGKGLKRSVIFKLALALNDILSRSINNKISGKNRLSGGRVLSAAQTSEVFPLVNKQGLQGAAFWQDGFAAHSPRLLIELVRWACAEGGNALNYFQATDLISERGKVLGVKATDTCSKKEYCFYGKTVINAAGPLCRQISQKWHRDMPDLFPHRILVWNVLFNRSALSGMAVAVAPPAGNSHTYFLPPWFGKLMVGTGHVVVKKGDTRPPSQAEIDKMISDLNVSIPGLKLNKSEIKRVQWGNMPGTRAGHLCRREVLIDHGSIGGPEGMYSVSGVKFTTARLVADRFFNRFFSEKQPRQYGRSFFPQQLKAFGSDFSILNYTKIMEISQSESVVKLSDLIMRRTNIADADIINESDLLSCASRLPQKQNNCDSEIAKIKEYMGGSSFNFVFGERMN